MKGGVPGEELALTPHSPVPPLPQAGAWDPPGTPWNHRFPHGLPWGLQVRALPARLPVLSLGHGDPGGCTRALQSQQPVRATVFYFFHPPVLLDSQTCAASP